MSEQVDLKSIPISPEGGEKDAAAVQENMADKLVTVFHDKDNFNVKHPLQNKWTLWFTKPSSGKVSPAHSQASQLAAFPARPLGDDSIVSSPSDAPS